jgi:hypothetical protein
MTPPAQNRWKVGRVDRAKEHIELRVGDENVPRKEWTLVALIAPPKRHVFTVEFIVTGENLANQDLIAKAQSELQLYLVELRENDQWAYARYHCSTSANSYSDVHWSYHRPVVGLPISLHPNRQHR